MTAGSRGQQRTVRVKHPITRLNERPRHGRLGALNLRDVLRREADQFP